jgi:hypothetical protein
VSVVLGLFGEGVSQPSEAAHGHTHREVLTLGIAGADVLQLGAAFHAAEIDASAFAGAVATQSAHRLAVVLDVSMA